MYFGEKAHLNSFQAHWNHCTLSPKDEKQIVEGLGDGEEDRDQSEGAFSS